MHDVRADKKSLLRDGKPLAKHMLTYDLMDSHEQI